MPKTTATPTRAALLLALAASAAACGTAPLPPIAVASDAESKLGVLLEPDATIGQTLDERGRDLLVPFHDAIETALSDAGYHLVKSASDPHDLTLHVRLARVGFTYGAWADGVVLEATGSGQTVAEARRASLNFVHYEGPDTGTRLKFAARSLVNALSHDAQVEAYASAHRAAAPPK